MPTYLDLESWPRREQFHFFREYDNPFFNVCVQMDVAALRQLPREEAPFFLTYHYLALKAANETEPFRYRLRGDRVLVHDTIHIGTTILLDDGERFGFCYFDWDEDFSRFAAQGKAALEALRSGDGRLEPAKERDDLIHGSVLPWISFTSFSHARKKEPGDSVPKIVFGKVFQDRMPVSVEVHHALMDGVHVGRFLERLQGLFSDPAPALGIRSAP